MSILNKSPKRPPKDALLDYRQHPRLLQIAERLAELKPQIPQAHAARVQAEADIKPAENARYQMELEILAERSPESALAPLQAEEMRAKRAFAMRAIHLDDLQKERSALEQEQEAVEKQARQEAAKNLRQESLALLDELAAALERVAAIDERLYALFRSAGEQFPPFSQQQVGVPDHAGLRYPGHSVPGGEYGYGRFATVKDDASQIIARIRHAREAIQQVDAK